MPCSSPRSSGCRATDWIIELKMLPMPTPAPSAPRPTPRASPRAFPAFVPSPEVAARTVESTGSSLVFRLDGRADVDGGQGGEDEGLDADDDHDLEEVEDRRHGHDRHEQEALQDEHQADEREDQDVAGEHVREETDGERDQPHELAEDLERHDQREERLRRLGDPALEVAHGTVPADALEVREDEGEERQREGDRERRGRRVDAEDRDAVPRLARQRKRDEPDQVDDEDEEHQRGDVREPAPDRLRGQALLGHLRLGHVVDQLAGRPAAGQRRPAHQDEPEQHRQRAADHQVPDGLRDREVQRAEVDRHPLVLLELRRRVEMPARVGGGGKREREEREGRETRPHRGISAKYAISESPSWSVYASPYVSAAPSARSRSVAAAARRTTSSPIALKKIPNACTPEAARLLVRDLSRASSSSSAWTPIQRVAASPQAATRQPATRKTGSASAITSRPPSVGTRRLGTGRGVSKTLTRRPRGSASRRRRCRPGSRRRRRLGSRARLSRPPTRSARRRRSPRP